jgi:hypothetical protein
MTPYAELLIRPIDATDTAVRLQFHLLSRTCHPDLQRSVSEREAKLPRWYALVAAYVAINTQERRTQWQQSQALLAVVKCAECQGAGVTGTRVGRSKIAVCVKCKGEGR